VRWMTWPAISVRPYHMAELEAVRHAASDVESALATSEQRAAEYEAALASFKARGLFRTSTRSIMNR